MHTNMYTYIYYYCVDIYIYTNIYVNIGIFNLIALAGQWRVLAPYWPGGQDRQGTHGAQEGAGARGTEEGARAKWPTAMAQGLPCAAELFHVNAAMHEFPLFS